MTGIANELGPEWLTMEYIQNVLRKYNKDSGLRVFGMDIKLATSKGENYASILNRIKVDYQSSGDSVIQTGSYIVKTTHEGDPFIQKTMKPYQIYATEMLMYEKILPQLTALLAETGDSDKLFADTIYVDYEKSAIIFEDLTVSNFTVADRIAGMDLHLTKLSLKKLAKMHAAAAVLNERQPGLLTKFDHGIFNRYTRGFSPFFESMIEVCANFAGNCPELGNYYKEKLLKLRPHVVEYATRAYDLNKSFFNTLNHGDYWTNNVMVRYDSNGEKKAAKQTVKDLLVIDFQFCCWTSPAVDLYYLFNTSLESELRLLHQDSLVQYYYEILADTLKRLKFRGHIPSLHEFWVQMEAGRFYGKLLLDFV